MPAASALVLLTVDRELTRSVALACAEAGLGLPLSCSDTRALERCLRAEPTGLILVDLADEPLPELARLAPLLARYREARVVLLCPSLDSDLLLKAMQLGARHCVHKVNLRRDLPPVLRRLQELEQPSEDPGRGVVTIVPARSGSGATTVAINLAAELCRSCGQPTLLVDGDVHYGSISSYLGLHARYGLSDVLASENAGDSALITTTASVHAEGLHVLVSPVSIDFEQPSSLEPRNLPRMLRTAGQLYPWVLVDLPRWPIRLTGAVARHSDLTVIVFQLAVHDVRSARALLDALEGNGVDPSSILLVANRYRRRGDMVGLEDARKALGGSEIVTLSNDYESAVRAINLGQALASVAPRSILRNDLRELATRLARRNLARRAS